MSKFKTVYPVKDMVTFDGGMNSKFQKSVILDNESPDCKNVRFTDRTVSTREGVTQVTSTAVSGTINGIFTFQDNVGNSSMLVFTGQNGYYVSGSTFVSIPSANDVFASGNTMMDFAMEEGYVFMGDGVCTPYKYNGTEFTRHGIPAPASACTASTASTGSVLSGNFQYKVAYENSNVVWGDVNSASNTFTAASENILVSSIPVAPQSFGVNKRKLYRSNSGATYQLVTTIDNNTDTTYEDGVADSALGADAPTDNGEPPNYKHIVYHQQRLWMDDPDNPNYLWYSENATPYTVASTNFFRVGDNTSDVITGLAVYEDSLVIFCRGSIWMLYIGGSPTPADWVLVRANSPFGSIAHKGHFTYLDKLMFPAFKSGKFVGFAALQGGTVTPSPTELTSTKGMSFLQSDRIEPELLSLGFTSNWDQVVSAVFDNRAYITVDQDATRDRVWVFDFSIENISKEGLPAWSPDDGFTQIEGFTVYQGKLYYAESGQIYQYEDGSYNDDGGAIDSYWWTKQYGGLPQDEPFHKDFRFANIHYKPVLGALKTRRKVNDDEGDTDTDDVTGPDTSLWGTDAWGEFIWSQDQDSINARHSLGAAAGKYIQFQFHNSNTTDTAFSVYGLKFAYNRKGYR